MMYSQFDNSQGGGFMSSQATQSTDFVSTQTKNRDTQGLVPLTVKQITESFNSNGGKTNIAVDGVDVNNITVVGMVCNKDEKVTENSFVLDDGTGKISCHRWMNEGIDTKEMEEIQDGLYVRVIGHLKGFQGKMSLVVFSVRPVTNFDEVAYHFIECVYFHVNNTKSQKMQGSSHGQLPTSNLSMGTNGSMGSQAPGPSQISEQYSINGLKGLDQKVLEYLEQPANHGREKGVHRDELAQQLKVPLVKIMESISTLEVEGAIYSTIDESHFKSARSG